MKAIRLRTEYLENPVGLGITSPRFFWNCDSGVKQTAYQITAIRNGEEIWNTGRVISDTMTHIRYEGKPLKSRDVVKWSVQLWDEQNKIGESSSASFEMGLLEHDDWKAKWISGNYKPQKNTRYPVDCFRKQFCTESVAKARLYITACGLYEAKLNGCRVGDFILAPGATDYRKRLQYQTYDVTDLLREKNSLEIQLADGWYRGSIGCFGVTNVFGRQTKLMCQLEITHENGTREIICSDSSFAWSNDGPTRFADLKDGEIVNATMVPSYKDMAIEVGSKGIPVPTASDNVFPKMQEHFTPTLITTPSGKQVLDFGQNIAGLLRFSVQGKPNQRLRLTLGEILDETGEFTQKNMVQYKPVKEFGGLDEILIITGNGNKVKGEKQPTPMQRIDFFCSGSLDSYCTKFAVFGFRYALVEFDGEIDPKAFEAVAVYSDMEQTGDFRCSHEGINKLLENTRWSMKGNYLDVPTDCPTRERLAWTGDAQIFFDTGAYLMDTAAFFRKWMRDVRDNQFKDGKISAVVPYNGASMLYDNTGSSVGWGDAAVLIPYRYWKRYGDDAFLQEFYPVMRGYAEYMIAHTGHKDKKQAKANPLNKYIYEKGVQLGEWLEPEEFKDKVAAGKLPPCTEEATAYLHYTMTHMAEVARYLGKPEDEKRYSEYAAGAKKAYCALFLRSGAPDTDRQAKLVRPLALGLTAGDATITKAVEERLVEAVQRRNYRIATGFLSTSFVLGVLTRAGRKDLAYKMLENKECPGWLYEVDQGATTVWESWEGVDSHNHYSPGAVCQWLFDTCAGIRVDGRNHFAITPVPGGSMEWAEASYTSLYGKVTSRWERSEAALLFQISVPANCAATISLPEGRTETVAAGNYTYQEDYHV